MITEADEAPNPPSAGRGTRKAGGVINLSQKGWEAREAAAINPEVWRPENQELQCLWAGKNGCPSSKRVREFSLPLPFCPIHTLNELKGASSSTGEDASLHSIPNHMLVSIRNTSQTYPEMCWLLSWMLISPVQVGPVRYLNFCQCHHFSFESIQWWTHPTSQERSSLPGFWLQLKKFIIF